MSPAVHRPSVVKLPNAWFIACRGESLAPRAVLPFTLQGLPLVAFRDAQGVAHTLLDRCPHRNAPLSLGSIVNGQLQCAYHGWRFDGDGQCQAVPGLLEGEAVSLKSRCAEAFATCEQDGYVWVCSTSGPAPAHKPLPFPHWGESGYTSLRRTYQVKASLLMALENTLDVPHTAFLHGGLFRTAKKKNTVEVVVRRFADRAEAQFIGEPRPEGLLGKVLAPGGGVVEHVDRFLLPSTAQVEYRLGKSYLVTTSVMTPVEDFLTRVDAVITFKLPLPGFLVKPFVAPIGERIFAQDAKMLEAQTKTMERFGAEKWTSSELDVLGAQIWRLLKQAAQQEAPASEPYEHRLKILT